MLLKTLLSSAAVALLLTTAAAGAAPRSHGEIDVATVAEIKQCEACVYVSAKEAHAIKTEGGAKVLFVDVRGPLEVQFVGRPDVIDRNIPYVLDDISKIDEKRKEYQRMPNSDFALAVEEAVSGAGLDKSAAIILMCRSGDRSALASNLLAKAGYSNVMSVVDGFEGDKAKDGEMKGKRVVNGWRNAGLPWGYGLDPKWAYISLQ